MITIENFGVWDSWASLSASSGMTGLGSQGGSRTCERSSGEDREFGGLRFEGLRSSGLPQLESLPMISPGGHGRGGDFSEPSDLTRQKWSKSSCLTSLGPRQDSSDNSNDGKNRVIAQ